MPELILSTERLSLKGITPALINELFKNQNKDEIIRFFGFDEANYEKLKLMHEKGMETDRISLFYFLVSNNQNNPPIGECGFHTWNTFHHRAEIFYLLRNDSYKQKGYMTEVLPFVIDYGFNELKLNRIEALVAENNVPSIKLLLRNGFSKESTVREHYYVNGIYEDSECYSLLKSEWKKK